MCVKFLLILHNELPSEPLAGFRSRFLKLYDELKQFYSQCLNIHFLRQVWLINDSSLVITVWLIMIMIQDCFNSKDAGITAGFPFDSSRYQRTSQAAPTSNCCWKETTKSRTGNWNGNINRHHQRLRIIKCSWISRIRTAWSTQVWVIYRIVMSQTNES